MPGGFGGKFLRVDLTTASITIEEVPDLVRRMYLGGSAMAAYLLVKELRPGVDPLGPENMLVMAACPTNGAPLSGTTRYTVAAKSPLTGGFGEGEAGGWWGPELKAAGFDAVIVTGQSPRPVYLWVGDGKAELRDASGVWGKLAGEAQDILVGETEKRARVLQCGIAGERGVRMANVVNELKHFNGRTGLGAVMGSKRLRAVVVRGHGKLEPRDPKGIDAVLEWFRATYNRETDMLHKFGTPRNMVPMSADGILPTHNFTKGQFDHAREVSGQTMAETIMEGRGTCFACSIACKREVNVPELGVSSKYGGPEYETIAASGPVCDIADLKAIAKFHQLCGEYVMDTISVGMAIGFGMECFEKGLLTKADTDGIELCFGNADAMLAMTEKIGRREGFGAVLGDGVKRAAARIGKGAEEFALHVKGQELPMHEPRGKQGLSLAYATAPTGADHMRGAHDPTFEGLHPHGAHALEPLGLCEPIPRLELSPRKVRAFYYASMWHHVCSSMGVCQLAIQPVDVLSMTQVVNLVRAITGWDTSLWELVKVAERGKSLARVFNCREGFTPKDDRLPKRLHEAFTDGPLKGVRVDPEKFAKAVRLYHQMEGWDPDTGWPTFAKLAELGVEWAARPGEGW